MKILYLAPLPPPITGHSIASQVLLEHLKVRHSVQVVDLSEGSEHNGTVTLKRLLAVLAVIKEVMRSARSAERLYITISESIVGNLKDLLIYLVIGTLIKRTVIHLHGGSFGRLILERSPILLNLNRFFVSRMAAVVVSGPSHSAIFSDLIAVNRIHTIPNFAQSFMFLKHEDVERKFRVVDEKIRVLFVSGMTIGKGYLQLLEAYESLRESYKSRIQINFAGQFESQIEQQQFTNRISQQTGVVYHGVISNDLKAKLFADAHVFCLPTSFLEGQPISIIEAYASGCVVLSTPRPGILDIFEPLKNGYLISSEDPNTIKDALEDNCLDLSKLKDIAMHNRRLADTLFREGIFCERVEHVLTDVSQ